MHFVSRNPRRLDRGILALDVALDRRRVAKTTGGGGHKSRGDSTSVERANTCMRNKLISVNTVPHTRSLLNSHQTKGTSFGPAAGGAPVNYKT
eukprot:1187669-Prorocentrum_minimum.AAC.3